MKIIMEKQTIYIKGMVCNRCVITVKNGLEQLGYQSVEVSLGEASFIPPAAYNQTELENKLSVLGFSLLEDKNIKIVKEVKSIVQEVYSGDFDFPEGFQFSKLSTARLSKDYEAISDVFVSTEKKTIGQYIIDFRINKVKELLVYTTLTLADIAFKLNFNSVAHLSNQFKQQTGLTPSFFKEVKKKKEEVTPDHNKR
jgi:AraC family transcriptional regulator